MNICIIYARGRESGSFVRAQYISKYLRKEGHNVRLLNPLPNLPFYLDIILSLIFYSIRIIFERNDVVISVKSFPNSCIPALISRALHKSRIVLDYDDLEHGYRRGFLSKVSRIISSPFPRMFDLVTTHNDNIRDFLVRENGVKKDNIYILDQGVDLELFSKRNVRKIPFIENLKKKNKVVVYVAHLDVSNDISPIIEIFRHIKEKRDDMKLVLAGGGPQERQFRQKVKKSGLDSVIMFAGYIQKEDLPSYMSAGDLNMVYYKNNHANLFRVPMKIREYLVFSVPVVSNDFGDLKRFERYTYQTKTDTKEFAKKIIELLTKKHDRRYLKGRKLIEEKYSWAKIIKPFSKRLKEL